MQINTELIKKSLSDFKSDIFDICDNESINLEYFTPKMEEIESTLNTLNSVSIFVDDKDFLNEFVALKLVSERIVDNQFEFFENENFRKTQIESLNNMGISLEDNMKVDDKKKVYKSNVEKENIKKNAENLVDKANESIKNYFREPKLMKEYLNYMAKFYNYSPRNLALIEDQFKGAEAVGSFKFWSDNGFKINKGEKGIKILAPTKITYLLLNDKVKQLKYATKEEKEKVKKGEIETTEKIFYKNVYVFDVSQTNAKSSDLPKLFPNKWLDGEVKDYDKLYKAMEKIAENIGVKIIEPKEELGMAKGISYTMTKEVALNPRNSQLQNTKTLLHELAHAKLHTIETRNKYSEEEREYQAEMIAYTTCSYFGLDTSEYSLNYLYNWSKDMDLDKCLDIIKEVKDTSSEYIKIIEDYMNEDIEKTLEKEIKKDEKNNEITDIGNELDYNLNNESKELYVKFRLSEHEKIENGSIYTYENANKLLEILTDMHEIKKEINKHENKDYVGYYKTDFEIYENVNCLGNPIYEGRFEIGSGYANNLSNHIYKAIQEGDVKVSKDMKNKLFKKLGIKKTVNKQIEYSM